MMNKLLNLCLLLLLVPNFLTAEDDPFQFKGDRLSSVFTKGSEKTLLRGNARIESGNLVILADEIELSGKNFRYAICRGNIKVRDNKKDVTIDADTMEYDRVLKLSKFRGNCEMQDAPNEIVVRSGYFEYDEIKERMDMQIGVRIFKKDMACRSENAVYSRKQDTLELTGLPQVNKKKDEYKAGTIQVNLKTDEILLDGRVTGSIIPDKKKESSPEVPMTSPGAATPVPTSLNSPVATPTSSSPTSTPIPSISPVATVSPEVRP